MLAMRMRACMCLWMRSAPTNCDHDGDFLGRDWRVMRDVLVIAQQQLKRVLPQWKGNLGFRLPCPEMQVIEVIGYLLVQWRQRRVNQKVMMTRIRLFHTRWRDAHVKQTKANGRCTRYDSTVG
jgi:hypothetical protein